MALTDFDVPTQVEGIADETTEQVPQEIDYGIQKKNIMPGGAPTEILANEIRTKSGHLVYITPDLAAPSLEKLFPTEK